MNDIIWWHFPQSRQNIKYCPEFNSGEVSRFSQYGEKTQNSFPELNTAWGQLHILSQMNMHEANYHNEVALNRELYNAILTSNNAN